MTLLGPSGCGKTTTLRLIAGLEMASEGQILIGGKDVTLLSAAERDVSMVFQSYALFPHMTRARRTSPTGRPCRACRKARGAGAGAWRSSRSSASPGWRSARPSELSGGQQQRVAVARALVLEPQVLLFDEPLSNLDAKLRRRVREDIRELQRNLNLTVAYVTHDQEEALAVSDRIIVMSNAPHRAGGHAASSSTSSRRACSSPTSSATPTSSMPSSSRSAASARWCGSATSISTCRAAARSRGRSSSRCGRTRVTLHRARARRAPALAGRVTKASYLGKHSNTRSRRALGALFVIDRDTAGLIDPGTAVWAAFASAGVTVIPA